MDMLKSKLSMGKTWAGLGLLAQMAKGVWPGHNTELDAFTWLAAAMAVGMQ